MATDKVSSRSALNISSCQANPTQQRPDRLLCSVREAERMIDVGHTKFYELINDGMIKTLKIGRKRMVVLDSVYQLLRDAD